MADEVMVIFTAKSIETCLEVGGTQSWVLDRAHAKRCKYALLCRNANSDWGDGKEAHGTAFMIGRICDVVPSTDTAGRWLVKFDEFAHLDIPNYWKGWRNPVRYYKSIEELSVSLDSLQFEPMPAVVKEVSTTATSFNKVPYNLTITEAKKALATTFGVNPEAIEIIIHG